MDAHPPSFFFFFFNDTATTEIYTLSLHYALPISVAYAAALAQEHFRFFVDFGKVPLPAGWAATIDRKSTRLNSSHLVISYAVFCLKKKMRGRLRAAMGRDFQEVDVLLLPATPITA